MDIDIQEAKFRKIITLLDEEIVKLENVYAEIEKESKHIDGTSSVWSGKTQTVVYDYYKSISPDFPKTVERFKSFSSYLKTTLDNYIRGENSINKDVDTSEENLDVN